MNTRQKIIKAALTLFAEKGYSDVYVSNIASAVGIKAPSLYKHFKSKQEIFESILEELKKSYTEQAAMLSINGSNADADAAVYSEINEETLIKTGTGLFLYFLHNENMKLFRKMLTIEQYHDPELAQLYTKQYYDDPISYQSELFRLLIALGKFKECDPDILAMQFYTPIYTLITVCDRHPERETESLAVLANHIRQFNKANLREEQA